MNDLQRFCEQHQGRILRKWVHYFNIYDRYFSKYRDRPIVMVEIGVFKGGSLQMWKSYFAPGSLIIGIDINPACKNLEEENIQVHIGSQDDPLFVKFLFESIPAPDIILDDGGHLVTQQIKGFELMFPYVKADGVYMCEDVQTSYWLKYGGGLRRRGTFMEYMKSLTDQLNEWSYRNINEVGSFARSVFCISFHDSVIVVEKSKIEAPEERWYGKLEPADNEQPFRQKLWKKAAVFSLDKINWVLQKLRLPSIYYGR